MPPTVALEGFTVDKILLIIASREDLACPGLEPFLPYHYTSHEPPPEIFLSQVGIVYVFDVDRPFRFEQLQACCHYQRRFGGIDLVIGLSRWFADLQIPSHRKLAEHVLDAGAQILPQFGSGACFESRVLTGGQHGA